MGLNSVSDLLQGVKRLFVGLQGVKSDGVTMENIKTNDVGAMKVSAELTGSNVDIKGYYDKANNNLSFSKTLDSGVNNIAFAYNQEKYLYYVDYVTGIGYCLKRLNSIQADMEALLIFPVNIPNSNCVIQRVYIIPGDKVLFISRDTVTNTGYVYYISSFTAAPQLVLSATEGCNFELCNSASMDSINPYFFVGEYNQGENSVKKLYKFDFTGLTFSVIKTTTYNQLLTNNHWHAIVYDKYTGWIWASHGDTGNQGLIVSKDGGSTWVTISTSHQPTLILPMRDRVILGSDNNTNSPGFDCVERNINSNINTLQVISLYTFLSDFSATNNYPDYNNCAVNGDLAFVVFPSNTVGLPSIILVTYDGGENWNVVYIDNSRNLVTPRIAFGNYVIALSGTSMTYSIIPSYKVELESETYYNNIITDCLICSLAIRDTNTHNYATNSANAKIHYFNTVAGITKTIAVKNGLNQDVIVNVQYLYKSNTVNGLPVSVNIGNKTIAAGTTGLITSADISILDKPMSALYLTLQCSVAPTTGYIDCYLETFK